jgi:DNA-binding MarR family transcriptional regulator
MDYLKLASDFSGAKRQMARIPNFRKFINPDNGENFVLGYLDDSITPVSPKEISEAMNVSSARIASIINQLELKGMVRRKTNENDGRYTVVELLPAGEVQRQKNIEAFNQSAACFLESLGPEDAVEYVRLQKKIADIYSKKLNMEQEDFH